jgi:PAS domain S-box-containing protein
MRRRIAELEEANRALRTSEARYRELVECTEDLHTRVDARGRFIYVNAAARRVLGLPPDACIGLSAMDFVDSRDRSRTERWFVDCVRKRASTGTIENRQVARTGEAREMHWTVSFHYGENGRLEHANGIARDISERKKSENELRNSETRIRALLDGSPICNKIIDLDSRLRYMSAAGREQLKIADITPYYGQVFPLECYPESIRAAVAERLERAKAGETTSIESPVLDAVGNELWFHTTFVPSRDDDGRIKYVIASSVNTTNRKRAEKERRELEAQLHQSQKMEAVGQLAGGVAHDFNNILTAILGNVDMSMDKARAELGAEHDVVAALKQIEQAARRASTLTRQLLTFSRRDVLRPEALSLNHILTDLGQLLRLFLTKNIQYNVRTEPGLKSVLADVSLLEQVIVNLVVNAVHAMPDGGRLTIETRNVTLDASHLPECAEVVPGPYVLLMVSDTGHGMDDVTRERIFEPFFSTKPVGQGTGLGLATVHGIVKQAGGHIDVVSDLGRGTTFKVHFPAVDAPPVDPRPKRTEPTYPRGHETVLICESDGTVRELVAWSLRSAGYTVLAAGSGHEAVELARDHAGPIHLLITDVIMPDVNGCALAERLRATRPELPVMFTSGYTSSVITHHRVLQEGAAFIEKPFTRHDLLVKVREVLGTTEAGV